MKMRRLFFCIFLLLGAGGLLFGQATVAPICNGFNASGAPINTTTNSTVCTDYFGAGNWATSPLPAGVITGYTLIAGGTGYTAPTVTVTDMTGASLPGASAPTPVVTGGVITGFTGGTGGTGYTAPVITIMDPTGSGALATAIIGPPYTGGIKKFQDPFFDLKSVLAHPDAATFPNSDYYEIQLRQYQQSLSPSNLPPTTLRGYVQVPTGTVGCGGTPVVPQQYLGPVILAQKGRPVRVKFTNCLPAGSPGGDLFIPVDTTYMGAGMGPGGAMYTQNRATLHLHGGATPWISDGTPHQWTVPLGEPSTLQKGDSVANVPDMWFDATGMVITDPSCAGKPTCALAGATNNPGQGALSFFWTNDQGARLMFYHDHAYGLTRLNVYAGEAAGYLLTDPIEEDQLANATVPGTIGTAPDLSHLIPLVIQDKTLVPSGNQLMAQDPTWAGNFGISALNTTTSNGNGDLWFPHVYMPNQNPNDPNTGASGFGHWDYGPWFFPPQTSLTAGPITTTCTSAAFPGQTFGPTASCPSCGCPITPNPSGTPEAFMDTPIVNGVAYPVLHLAPAAYRFKILSAGNDRSLNLSWFVADSTQGNTEVAMLPAVPPGAGTALPLCSAVNPVAVPPLVLGLATGLLDNLGNPLNGTGLPGSCWPNYGPQPGIPAPQTMWAADGRAGGAPDPRNAGPAWVQIGTEGGLLPAPVVIPPTPVNFEQNVRSITIGSVAVHGLWLGPAERADVVVDFSNFAGKTLILYNDAPAPAPASDSRLDYFTGDGDQSPIGGAPNTPPGYGPNTRTIMQVVVDTTNPNNRAFSLTAVKNAFASPAGVFASTQPTIVVPQPPYDSVYGGNYPPNTAAIQATTMTFTPIAPQTFDSSCGLNCVNLDPKTIQELFTVDYGRMNATLGTELPNVNFQNQTTIPLGYVDPATEIIKQGETQLWKITHNGVDTHFIHFHLFNVQVINRVGWDGSMRQIDPNEAGWKDTVRMNPLEDIVVALQPITPPTPFPLANSIRALDVSSPIGTTGNPPFSNLNPYTNAGVNTVNALQNFGWEYVWHCHILGHEENDMMRPIIFQVPPPRPSGLVATAGNGGRVDLVWTDNSANETGFVVQRADDALFSVNVVTLPTVPPSSPLNAAGEGISWGGPITSSDRPGNGTFFYRVQAVDNGWAGTMSQSYNASILGSLSSAWSDPASVGTAPSASLSSTSLTFTGQFVNTTSAPQTVTLTNAGPGPLAITGITVTGTNAADFAQSNTCGTAVAAANSCTITVTFTPKATGARSATVTITSTNPTALSITLSGSGTAPVISPSNNGFQFGSITVGTTTTPQTLTLVNTGNANLVINSYTLIGGNTGDFATTASTCTPGISLAAGGACTIGTTFTPAAMGNRSTVLRINSNDPVTPALNISLSGFGTQSIAAVSPTSLTFPQQLVNTTSAAQTVTLSNNGNVTYSITSISLGGTNPTNFVLNYNCPIGGKGLAAGTSCSVSLTFRPIAAGSSLTATVNIITNANVNPATTVPVSGKATQVNLSTLSLTYAPQVVGTTSANQSVTLTNTGPAALGITSVALTNANPTGAFVIASNNCPLSLGTGASCRVSVAFRPTSTSPATQTANLTFTTNDGGQTTWNVALTGTAIQAAVSLTPTSHGFGLVTARTTSAPYPFLLTNLGTATLANIRLSLGGADPGRFNISSTTCGTTLAVGGSCTINVTFSPQRAGTAYSATLQVGDNAPGSPQTATLTGTGQ
jgi:FtsP/CotA-like multicopper oxidase with cupredoxin domain